MNLQSNLRGRLLVAGFSLLLTWPAVAADAPTKRTMGTINAVQASHLDVQTTAGPITSFLLTATTEYRRGDAAVKAADLKVGERAVVRYESRDGSNVAVEVKLSAGGTDAVAVADRFASALQSDDREGALACLAPDVVIFEHGSVESSRDEYAKHHLDGDLEYLRAIKIRVVDRRVLPGADRAVIMTRSESTGEFRGKPVSSIGTETLVLERRSAGWLIVHVHWSSGKRS
ncbi:MAG: nuclear transport factor 2 family protein [Acidobacteriota bacterium]